MEKNENTEKWITITISVVSLALSVFLITFLALFLCGCTLSFQNVDTHGAANKLIEDEQATSPTISPNIEVPLK